MTIPIRPDAAISLPLQGTTSPLEETSGGPSFKDLLARGINDASSLQDESKDMIASFLRGDPVELHQVMAATEEAGIAVEMLVEIRNKLTEAYRAVMNTQT
jgi:flagellar hook-basal body complex protein FliE